MRDEQLISGAELSHADGKQSPHSLYSPERIRPTTEALRLLLIEDDPDFQLLLHHLIGSMGQHHLERCSTGAEALSLLESVTTAQDHSSAPFDMVLLDLNLPDIHGLELMDRIREVPWMQHVPVALLTADTSLASLNRAFELGAVEYITKPIRSIDLVARVRDWTRQKCERIWREHQARALNEAKERLESTNHRLMSLAATDPLTGLASRSAFDEQLLREWRRCRREALALSLLMLKPDVPFNSGDLSESQQLDRCVEALAHVLRAAVYRAGDLIARYQEGSCVIILPGTSLQGALHVAERLRNTVEKQGLTRDSASAPADMTVSIGVSCQTTIDEGTIDGLLDRTALALEQARTMGRSQVMTLDALQLS